MFDGDGVGEGAEPSWFLAPKLIISYFWKEIREKLCLSSIVVVMDQALYAKAAEIVWKEKRFLHIILRMGVFHTICNGLSILGKRFGDAGLKDLLIESHIAAEGSIRGVIEGKHYNRAIRVHKVIYEALMRLAWDEYIKWLNEKASQEQRAIASSLLDLIASMDLSQKSQEIVLQSQVFLTTIAAWREFLDYLRHSNGELSSYWMTYIDFVEDVILGLLRASREGNWDLHLHSIRELIPWCFAYHRVNYARYLTPYFAQMTNLKDEHPEVEESFKAGWFSVQLSNSNTFGRLPVDQTTEVTVNRDTKTSGGTTGFSLKPAAVQRHYLTAELHSAFLRQVRSMVERRTAQTTHTDLQASRKKKDETAVSNIIEILQG